MKVAVIDSGVNPNHPHISGVLGGIGFVGESGYLDLLGHGTAVMAAIQSHAPADISYFAVKVFHQSLQTSSPVLRRAFEWVLDEEMDVVNLSLGTANEAHLEVFAPLVTQALSKGIRLVSAAGMLPGTLPGVMAAAADPALSRDQFRYEAGIYHASPFPRPIPGLAPERNLAGVSFAVANLTGLLLREWASRSM